VIKRKRLFSRGAAEGKTERHILSRRRGGAETKQKMHISREGAKTPRKAFEIVLFSLRLRETLNKYREADRPSVS
jgi:hypothetical protein